MRCSERVARSRSSAPTFVSQLERGLTLPASWYSDPAVLRLEQERIFRRSWQYAGVADESPSRGSSSPAGPATCRSSCTRDREGELRAFVNVCRHRGHEVASGCGRRETLQCPYHAWTYGLDGSLRVGATLRPRAGIRRCRVGPPAGARRHLGAARVREPGPGGGTARRDARRAAAGRARARARPCRARVPRAARGSGSSRRTGSSSSRTTSSATTAPSRTRASAG